MKEKLRDQEIVDNFRLGKMPDQFKEESAIPNNDGLYHAPTFAIEDPLGYYGSKRVETKANVNIGDHFWAKVDNQLVVLQLSDDGCYYACGPWEGTFHEEEFELIEKISKPYGTDHLKLYY